jgi:hypothetical protein
MSTAIRTVRATAPLAARLGALALGLVAVLALSLGLAGTASASTGTGETVWAPARITEFTMSSGDRWADSNAERLGRSGFVVTANGQFGMWQPDNYPQLVGTINPDGTFYASASATYGSTGSNSTEVQGRLVDNGDGTATISFTYTAGAVDAAVVNGTQFGSSRTKAYHATVELARV